MVEDLNFGHCAASQCGFNEIEGDVEYPWG